MDTKEFFEAISAAARCAADDVKEGREPNTAYVSIDPEVRKLFAEAYTEEYLRLTKKEG